MDSDAVETWWAAMPKPLPEYDEVVSVLKPVLHNLPGKIIAIDGPNGVGKSTLGRYLSHRFNSTLLETDLFAIKPAEEYRYGDMKQVVETRLNRSSPRPIFVEGVALLKTLDCMGLRPDFHIYWFNSDFSDSAVDRTDRLSSVLETYEREYTPKSKANFVISAKVPL
jgi:Cdc6-like AAA superfamily ATPase